MGLFAPRMITTMDDARRHRNYALILLMLVYACNFIDRRIMGVLATPIKQAFNFSDAEIGMLTGFFFAIVYTLIGVPIARIADATSRKGTLTISLVIWSAFTALSGLAWSKTAMIGARMAVGVGEAGGSPPAHAIVSDLYEPGKRGRALAIYSSGIYIGTLLANVGGGPLSDHFSWQIAFFVVGLPGVILALLVHFTLREPLKGLSAPSGAPAQRQYTFWQSFKYLWSLKSFRFFSLATGAGTFVTYGLNDWMVSFMERTHHLSRTEIGVTFGFVAGIFGAIGTIGGGFIADQLGKKDRRWFLWVPMWGKLLGAPIFLIGLFMPTPYLSLACYGVGLILAAAYLGPSLAVTHSLVPPGMRAMSSAVLYVFLNILGIGLGPMLVGMWSDLINDASACVLTDHVVQMAHACPKADDMLGAIRKAPGMLQTMQDAGLTKIVKGATIIPAPLTADILNTAVGHGFRMDGLTDKAGWGGDVAFWLRNTFPAVTNAGINKESLRWAMIACIILTYPLAFLWHLGARELPPGGTEDASAEALTLGDPQPSAKA